jgi:hypothetical protein
MKLATHIVEKEALVVSLSDQRHDSLLILIRHSNEWRIIMTTEQKPLNSGFGPKSTARKFLLDVT